MLKSKEKTCMVKEPSHVKQLSLNHMCKIGLNIFSMDTLYFESGLYSSSLFPVHNRPIVPYLWSSACSESTTSLEAAFHLIKNCRLWGTFSNISIGEKLLDV